MAFVSTAQRLVFTGALLGIACSKLAGFEELRGEVETDDSSNSGGGIATGGTGLPSSGRGFGGATISEGGTDTGSGVSAVGGADAEGGTTQQISSTGGSNGGTGQASSGSGNGGRGGLAQGGSAGTTQSVGGEAGQIGGCENALVANPGFEQGHSAWTESSTFPTPLEIIVHRSKKALVDEGVTPQAGDYLAWLGGIPDNEWDRYNVVLTQTVTIPTDATTLDVSGYVWIRTEEDPDGDYDWAVVEFSDDGQIPWQVARWSNGDATDGWVRFEDSTTELGDMRGKTLTLVLWSRTDLKNKTSFWLDSLRVVARCER